MLPVSPSLFELESNPVVEVVDLASRIVSRVPHDSVSDHLYDLAYVLVALSGEPIKEARWLCRYCGVNIPHVKHLYDLRFDEEVYELVCDDPDAPDACLLIYAEYSWEQTCGGWSKILSDAHEITKLPREATKLLEIAEKLSDAEKHRLHRLALKLLEIAEARADL